MARDHQIEDYLEAKGIAFSLDVEKRGKPRKRRQPTGRRDHDDEEDIIVRRRDPLLGAPSDSAQPQPQQTAVRPQTQPEPASDWNKRFKALTNPIWSNPDPDLDDEDRTNRMIDSYQYFTGVFWGNPEKLAKQWKALLDVILKVIADNLKQDNFKRGRGRNKKALYRKGHRHTKTNRDAFEDKRMKQLKSPLARLLALLSVAVVDNPQALGYKEITERLALSRETVRITRPLLRRFGFDWIDGGPGRKTVYWHSLTRNKPQMGAPPHADVLIANLTTAYENTKPLPNGDLSGYRKLDGLHHNLRDFRDLACEPRTTQYLPLLAQLSADLAVEFTADICHLYIRAGHRESRLQGWLERLKHAVATGRSE
jgi:hypothetical protein